MPNNLSLVLLQGGHDREALDLLEASVEQFPRFRPLFANAVQAARRIGDEELAKTLEARGRELLEDEPAWNFNEGMRSYHARSYPTAALRFEKALSADPDNVRLLAWSARAHLAAGTSGAGWSRWSGSVPVHPPRRGRSSSRTSGRPSRSSRLRRRSHRRPWRTGTPDVAARYDAAREPSTRCTASSSSRWVKGFWRKLEPGSRRSSGSICPSP